MARKPRYVLKRPADSKGRFKKMLGRRFLVRLHMALIMGAVIAAGLGTSKLLLFLGLTNMPARYGIVVCGGVLVFLVCIRLWLWYIHSSLVPTPGPDAGDVIEAAEGVIDGADAALNVVELAAEVIPAGGDAASLAEAAEGAAEAASEASEAGEAVATVGKGMLGLLEGEEAGIILFVIAVVLAVFFGVGIFLIWQAPIILAEAAFPAILVASLRRKGRDIDHPHWSGSVLKAVWLPAAIVLVVAVIGGLVIQTYCPEATTVMQALRGCVFA